MLEKQNTTCTQESITLKENAICIEYDPPESTEGEIQYEKSPTNSYFHYLLLHIFVLLIYLCVLVAVVLRLMVFQQCLLNIW